jgi:subtilisin family serine protease
MTVLAVSGVAIATPSAHSPAPTPSTLFATSQNREFVPGELIVRFESGVRDAVRASILRDEGATLKEQLPLSGVVVVKLAPAEPVLTAVRGFELRDEVRYAEPNWLHRISAIPNDPRFGGLWGLNQSSDADIDAPEAWNVTAGNPGIVVAVVDSGVAYQHPDIAPNMWPGIGRDFVDEDATPYDYNGHGTHVAGTIGAVGNNGLGVTGVNWDASIMALRAGDASGSLATTDIVQSFNYACENGARIVNGSFGGSGAAQTMYNAIVSPACSSTLFVIAAGNDNVDNDLVPQYPCNYHLSGVYGPGAPNIVCVAATDENDTRADFSNYGDQSVHLAAPGRNILSAWPSFQTIWGPDGFDDASGPLFDARWGDRTSTPDDQQWGRSATIMDSGTHSLTDSPTGLYAANSLTTIRRLAPFSLTGQSGCRAFYDIRLDTEFGFDSFLVLTGTTTMTTTLAGGAWGSTGGAFIPFDTDLSVMDGVGTVYLRLGLESDDIVNDDGVYIDDLYVACLNNLGETYETISGTSMATPHVAGVAALALAENPALNVGQLKSQLLAGIDILPSLSGLVATSGRLNACRALIGCGAASPPQPTPAPPTPPQPSPPPAPPPPAAPPPPRPPAVVRCVVPNVKGKTVRTARTTLTRRRCRLGRVTRTYSAKMRLGRVVSQSRRPGARLPRGTRVNVVVSRGKRRR